MRKSKNTRKRSVLRVIIMTFIIGIFAVMGLGLGVFVGTIKSAPDARTIDLKPQDNYTSFVYNAAGHEIASFAPVDNREYASLDKIPVNLQHAVIATEDERFYEHNGIDMKGILRAIVTDIKHGDFKEGASTITQQLVKNNVLSNKKKITRKIQEQYLAVECEKLYTKDKILEYYLNTIGLSQGVCGVQAASKCYFGKDVSKLSLSECVVLAVITQLPTYYDPIENPENNWTKVQSVLKKMEKQGYITPEEHAAALLEKPYDHIKKTQDKYKEKSTRDYFVDALFTQLVADLEDLGYSNVDAKKLIYGGGLSIQSTVDSKMQAIADKYIDDSSQYPENLYKLWVEYSVMGKKADGTEFEHNSSPVILQSEDEVDAFVAKKKAEWGITSADKIIASNVIKQPQPQASFVLMDYRTGQIKALAGGRGGKTNLGFNYVTQAKRQPGSAFKVLAAYAPALDTGVLSPNARLVNEHITYTKGLDKPWPVKNWDNNYSGTYSVTEAIANSMNVLAVKTLELVTVDTSFDYLKNFGFTTLCDSDKVLPLALGGITNGVTPLELNAAYGAIANDGVYVKPIFYTTVKDNKGQIIIDNTGENIAKNSHTVIKSSTAHVLTKMMQEVIDGPSKHTGRTVRTNFPDMPIAGKTGTTTDSKDLVFAGYTPYYVATIWTGYTQPEEISSRNGGNSYHLKIWGEIMNDIHKGLENKSFPESEALKDNGKAQIVGKSEENKNEKSIEQKEQPASTTPETSEDPTMLPGDNPELATEGDEAGNSSEPTQETPSDQIPIETSPSAPTPAQSIEPSPTPNVEPSTTPSDDGSSFYISQN